MMSPQEFHALEAEQERLEAQIDELSSQHDATSGTFFEDEPWYAEYEKLQARSDELDKLIDENEHLVAARRNREFLQPGELVPAGENAWDHWKIWAMEDGISEELAGLGRAVIREAIQHNWPENLKAECGWTDDGEAMLQLAKSDPERARIRWTYLLESGGDFHWK